MNTSGVHFVYVTRGGTGSPCDVEGPPLALKRGPEGTSTGCALCKLCWPEDEVSQEGLRSMDYKFPSSLCFAP